MVAGVYGIAEPDLYMQSNFTGMDQSKQRDLHYSCFDVVIRTFVSSEVERHLSEVNKVVKGSCTARLTPPSLSERTNTLA